MINQLVKKCQRIVKKCPHNFPEVTPLDCFFSSANSPKTRDSQLTVINDKEKQQILTFKKLLLEKLLKQLIE